MTSVTLDPITMTNAPTIQMPATAARKRAALASARTLLTHILHGVKRRVQASVVDPTAPSITAALTHPAAIKKLAAVAHHDAQREKISAVYLAAIKRCLMSAQAEALHKINGTSPVKLMNSAAVADFPFNLANFSKMFFAEMRSAGAEALQQSGSAMNEELGLAPGEFDTGHGIAKKFLIERENKLKDVPQEVYDRVKATLEQGTNAGETERQLAQRVADEMGAYENGNAQTIARTETASAYGTGRMDSLTQAGFTFKSWLTADDGKVRDSHEACEAQGAIPVGEPFGNGLDYPGDPEGAADEVINCRCVLQAAEDPEGGDNA